MHDFLFKLGFCRSLKHTCLYYKLQLFLLIYADDLIIIYKHVDDLNIVKQELRVKFKMKVFNSVRKMTFLDLEIEFTEDNTLFISQKALIIKILGMFNMYDCKTSNAPIQSKLNLL